MSLLCGPTYITIRSTTSMIKGKYQFDFNLKIIPHILPLQGSFSVARVRNLGKMNVLHGITPFMSLWVLGLDILDDKRVIVLFYFVVNTIITSRLINQVLKSLRKRGVFMNHGNISLWDLFKGLNVCSLVIILLLKYTLNTTWSSIISGVRRVAVTVKVTA